MKTNDLDGDGVVAAWNSLYPVGTPVHYWPGIRRGEGRTGVTRSAATLLGDHTPAVWVDGASAAIALTHVQAASTHVVEPCGLCGHAREGHSVRYVALEGDHEWRDPYARSIAHTTPRPHMAPPEPETRCDCAPAEFCTECDPWRKQPPTAAPADPARPSRFSRIANAARRTA